MTSELYVPEITAATEEKVFPVFTSRCLLAAANSVRYPLFPIPKLSVA